MSAITTQQLTTDAARALTGQIKTAVDEVWRLVKQAHAGQAHLALGYSTWAEYVGEEFKMSKGHSFRLLDYGELIEALAESPNGDSLPTEGAARPLMKLPPEERADAYHEAVQASPTGKPTAREVEAVVVKRRQPPTPGLEPLTPEEAAELARLEAELETNFAELRRQGFTNEEISAQLIKMGVPL